MPVVALDNFRNVRTAANFCEAVRLYNVESVEHCKYPKRFEWLAKMFLDHVKNFVSNIQLGWIEQSCQPA